MSIQDIMNGTAPTDPAPITDKGPRQPWDKPATGKPAGPSAAEVYAAHKGARK